MPGSFTDQAENIYLDHIFGGQTKSTFTPYIGYFLTTAGETSPGSEPVGNGYARVASTPDDWLAATAQRTQNVRDIVMPRASGVHGNVVGIGLWDSSIGGRCFVYFPATDFELIEARDSLIILTGGLVHQFLEGGFSHWLQNAILNDLYKLIPLPIFPTVWAANFVSGTPTSASPGTEPGGSGYSRLAIANNLVNFPAASGGHKLNGTTWEWPLSTGTQGTVSSVGFFTEQTGGQYLAFGPVTPPKQILINDWFGIAQGDMEFVLD